MSDNIKALITLILYFLTSRNTLPEALRKTLGLSGGIFQQENIRCPWLGVSKRKHKHQQQPKPRNFKKYSYRTFFLPNLNLSVRHFSQLYFIAM
jgi:hypothetical protein